MGKRLMQPNLDTIRAEIGKVEGDLRLLRQADSPTDRHEIDLKLKQLHDLKDTTRRLCPRTWGVWPDEAITTAPVRSTRRSRGAAAH